MFDCRLLEKNPAFEFKFRDHMQFKNVSEKIATYWLLRNKSRTKRPSLQVPPRVPIFTTHSPPSTPGFMSGTPVSPKDFNKQLSTRLNQLQHDNYSAPVLKTHTNPSIVVDSPGHHDEEYNGHSESRPSSNHTKPFSWGCCIPMGVSNRVAQNPSEPSSCKFSSASNACQESDGRKDSFESGRKDSHDSGILVNPAAGLQRVPEDDDTINSRQRRPGICESHQSSNVSEICQRFEEIAEQHKTKQERLAARKNSEEAQQNMVLA